MPDTHPMLLRGYAAPLDYKPAPAAARAPDPLMDAYQGPDVPSVGDQLNWANDVANSIYLAEFLYNERPTFDSQGDLADIGHHALAILRNRQRERAERRVLQEKQAAKAAARRGGVR